MKRHSFDSKGFLLALLIVPYLLYTLGAFSSYVTFLHRPSFQQQAANGAEENQQVFSFSKQEYEHLNWTETGKEFERDGKMYDVAKIEIQGDTYSVHCESDSLEDLFISLIKSAGKGKLKVNFQFQFCQPFIEFNNIARSNSEQTILPNYCESYLSIAKDLVTPPPRVS